MKIIQVLLLAVPIMVFSCFSSADENAKTSFLDWNAGEGTSLAGWTWHEDVGFDNPGWTLDVDAGGPHGGGDIYSIGQTRSFDKNDRNYPGAASKALIDITDRAPSTTTGGSLKIYDPTNNAVNSRAGWWLWYDGKPLTERGVVDENTDRMSFYVKTEGVTPLDPTNLIEQNANMGTYLCWDQGTPAYGTGDGCPYESSGQHYYHWLTINSGGWIHVLLDQMPQHRRGRKNGDPIVLNNPVKISDDKNYFEQLNQFYIETSQTQPQTNSMTIDEVEFYSTADTEEPNQNDVSVSSIAVGYFPATSHWEISWMDNSFSKYDDYSYSTFEVRWSLQPITNANWDNARPLSLNKFTGVGYTGKAQMNLIRRHHPYKRNVWSDFTIDPSLLSGAASVYFAVKDVSVTGANKGTSFPYSFAGDGHVAASPYIKTIDYPLSDIVGNAIKSKAKAPEVFNTRVIAN